MKKYRNMFRWALIAMFLGYLVSDCIGMPEGTLAVNQNNKAGAVMKLDDEIYFDMPVKLPDPLRDAVLGMKAGEIWVAAPAVVDLKKHKTIPILLAAAQTEPQNELVSASMNTAILSVDLDTGQLRMAKTYPLDATKTYLEEPTRPKIKFFPKEQQSALAPAPSQGFPPSPPPPPPMPPASIAQRWLDLRPMEGLSWKAGRYSVRALVYDSISNLSLIDIVEPDVKSEKVLGFPADRAHEIEMEARRVNSVNSGIKSFKEVPETPKLDKKGVKIAIPDQVRTKDEIPLYGAARLHLGARMIVDQRHFSGEIQAISESDLPGAIVPVTVLISELDKVPPSRIEIFVPFTGGELKGGEEVNIFFSVDLNAALNTSLNEGTYFVYALAGQYASGPHRLDVKND